MQWSKIGIELTWRTTTEKDLKSTKSSKAVIFQRLVFRLTKQIKRAEI